MTDREWDVIKGCVLFSGLSKDEIQFLLERCEASCKEIKSGEQVLIGNDERCVAILLAGKIAIYSDPKERVPLNRLKQGAVFGISALCGSLPAETFCISQGASKLLFLPADQSEVLLENKRVCKNLIGFFSNRIRFLNQKISALSASGAEGKLLQYCCQNADESGAVRLPRSLSELARSLNLGRASLYRAITKLVEKKIIEHNGKYIRLLHPPLTDSIL